ncbi:MAG TPA: aminoglycoside phosphotransferase family protein [Acidimicrobiales bacterium]
MSDSFALARARRALEEAGLPIDLPLERASSVTNEVWLSDRYVVRVNRQANQRLRREASIGPLLPAEVGYPAIEAYGGQLGADWLIVHRVPGRPLSRCWPGMTRDERRRAVSQIATMLRELHQFDCPDDVIEVDAPQLLGSHSFRAVDPLLEALERARKMDHVETRLLDGARDMVLATCSAIEPFHQDTFVHGDLTFENVLWDGYVVTAMLDFEFSREAPADLDLDVFLRFCAFPYLHVAEDYESETRAIDYAEVPFWMAEEYPELFSFPQSFDRLRLYSIAYDVRELLAFPPSAPMRSLSPHHPLRRLERTLDGLSHLDRLAGSIEADPISLDPGSPIIKGFDTPVPSAPLLAH